MYQNMSYLIQILLIGAGALLTAACSPSTAAVDPTSTPLPESTAPPSISWQIEDLETGETFVVSALVEIQLDQRVRVTMTASDPAGVSSISLNRNGFYKCRMDDEVQFSRSIGIGSSAHGSSEPEPDFTQEIIIDATEWRCPEGWELSGGFVDLDGRATNMNDQTSSDYLYVVN